MLFKMFSLMCFLKRFFLIELFLQLLLPDIDPCPINAAIGFRATSDLFFTLLSDVPFALLERKEINKTRQRWLNCFFFFLC